MILGKQDLQGDDGQFAAPPGSERRKRRRRIRLLAWSFSIGLHLILFIFCFTSLKGASVSGGAGTTEGAPQAIWVSLAGMRGGATAASAPTQSQLNDILRRIRIEQSPISADENKPTAKASLDDLLKTLDKARDAQDNPQDNGQKGKGRSDIDRGGSGSAADGKAVATLDKLGQPKASQNATGPGSTQSTGNLWGQIEPCWRRMLGASTVPVILQVTLNSKGLIAIPPIVVRPNNDAPDRSRLIAEARALAAVAACAPYHDDAGDVAGGMFTVNIAAKR